MELLKSLLGAAFIEGTPQERAQAYKIIFRVIVIVFMCWSLGFGYSINMPGFARADDLNDKVNAATQAVTQAAIEPLRTEVGKVSAKVDAIQQQVNDTADMVRQMRIDNLSQKLRDLHFLQCMTNKASVADRLATEIDAAQLQYKALTSERYPLDACKR